VRYVRILFPKKETKHVSLLQCINVRSNLVCRASFILNSTAILHDPPRYATHADSDSVREVRHNAMLRDTDNAFVGNYVTVCIPYCWKWQIFHYTLVIKMYGSWQPSNAIHRFYRGKVDKIILIRNRQLAMQARQQTATSVTDNLPRPGSTDVDTAPAPRADITGSKPVTRAHTGCLYRGAN